MRELKTEWQQLKDIKMAFWQHGSGPDLVLLHGNSGSKAKFKDYLLDYFADYHTYALDSRGHGESRSKDAHLVYEKKSLDVINFCKARGMKDVSVIGYSDGAILGLWLAVKAPEIFTKIVAISPNTLVSGGTEASTLFIEKSLKTMRFLSRFGVPLKKPIMRFNLMLTDSGIDDEDLMKIQTSVMVLYAERDMIKEDHILHIAGLIPDCRLEKVPDCNHMTIPYTEEAIRLMQEYLIS